MPMGCGNMAVGATAVHKNLQYLQNIAADPVAASALSFFCIHGYASDGVTAAGATPTQWNRWLDGWTTSPARDSRERQGHGGLSARSPG